MKYGVLYNKANVNMGDDIQAFATARFLPHVDYYIDRERMDQFYSENKEPVAMIMNAWYMWAKWHWPPTKYIVPKFVGFHYADHQLAKQPGSPFKYEFLTGIGGEYLKAHGPIGCRDMFTMKQLQSLGIDAYFSGCITMTLPQMPERKDKGTYICLVDLEPQVTNKMKQLLKDKDIAVKVITHSRPRDEEKPWEERKEQVIELLTLYQNARCVVTKKLHCSLPCLALGTPVFLIKGMEDDIRFAPYYDFLHRTTVKKFMKDDYDYDFMNPPANKEDFRPVREKLIAEIEAFVAEMEKETRTADELDKTAYTEEEMLRWRNDLMQESMDQWLLEYRAVQKSVTRKNEEIKRLRSGKKGFYVDCDSKLGQFLLKVKDFIRGIRVKIQAK